METNNAMTLTKSIHFGTERHLPAVLATALMITLVAPGPMALGRTRPLPGRKPRGRSVIFISGGKVEVSQLSRGDVVFIHAGRVRILSRSSRAPLRLVRARPKQAHPPSHRDRLTHVPQRRRPSAVSGPANATILSLGRRPGPSQESKFLQPGRRAEMLTGGREQSAGTAESASALVCAFGAEFQP